MRQRKDVLVDILQNEAGKDSLQDRFHVGYIAAVNDLLNMDIAEEPLEHD